MWSLNMWLVVSALNLCVKHTRGNEFEAQSVAENALQTLFEEVQNLRMQYTVDIDILTKRHNEQMALLQEQLDFMKLTVKKLDTKHETVVHYAEERRLSETIDTSDYSGIHINSEKAMLSLGSEADVRIVRTAAGILEVMVNEYHIHGVVHVNDLIVNGTNLTDLVCNCEEDNSQVTVTVEALTGTATDSDSSSIFYVEFYIPSIGDWTDPMLFFEATDYGSIEMASFVLDAEPTMLRFTIDGNNAWGIAQVAVWIDNSDEIIVLCSGVVGDNPSMGDNGHWIDGDGSGGAPTYLEYDIASACSEEVTVTARTGDIQLKL